MENRKIKIQNEFGEILGLLVDFSKTGFGSSIMMATRLNGFL